MSLQSQIDYFKSMNEQKYLLISYMDISRFHVEQLNDLRKALYYINTAFDNITITDDSEGNLLTLFNSLMLKADILFKMGKYDESLNIYHESLSYAKKLEKYDSGVSFVIWYMEVGELYLETGKFNEALENQKLIFEKLSKIDIYPFVLSTNFYYQSVLLFTKIGQISEAESTLKKFTEWFTFFSSLSAVDSYIHFGYGANIKAQYKISQALILQNKKTMLASTQAQTLLREVISDQQVRKELIIDSLLILIDFLIQEYKLYENSDTFDQITSFNNNLQEIAEGFSSIPLKIKTLILQGKLEIISGNLAQYETVMNTAKQYASDYNLTELKNMIETELRNFNSEIKKWEQILSTSIKDRLIKTEIEEYIKKMSQIVNE